MIRCRAALHELRCRECRVTWRSWLQRLVGHRARWGYEDAVKRARAALARHEEPRTWRREYDLVDGSTPDPVDPATTSEDTPAVDPFAPHRAEAFVAAVEAEAARYHDSACVWKADADRLAAALRAIVGKLESAMLFASDDIRARWGYEDAAKSARAALARHQEPQP